MGSHEFVPMCVCMSSCLYIGVYMEEGGKYVSIRARAFVCMYILCCCWRSNAKPVSQGHLN